MIPLRFPILLSLTFLLFGVPIPKNQLQAAQFYNDWAANRFSGNAAQAGATGQGWIYLAVVLDACSRKVVGWAMGTSLETFLVTEALSRAQRERRPAPGLLHHSDRGVQYASSAYRALLATFKITASMSRAANPYDNAIAESFMATFKTECFEQMPDSHAKAKLKVFDYIETFYNSKRIHSALGYKSPVEFENQFN